MKKFENFSQRLMQNNSQLALNKYGQNLFFPNSRESATRRDYILHRLGATFQQMAFLKKLIDGHSMRYASCSSDTGERLELTFEAINQLSYCFDNLIFNLGSMSDYFGNYLGLYIYGPDFQSLKWNGFVKKTQVEYRDDDFGKTVNSEHNSWFNRLHDYRGDIIHRKAILIEVEGFENKRVFPHTVEELNFEINDALKKYFHIFRNGESRNLHHCAEKICERTFDGFLEIIESSENIKFNESHKKFAR